MSDENPVAARADDAWNHSYPFWDAYFCLVLVVVITAVALDASSMAAGAAANTLLIVLGLTYVAVGRRAVRQIPTLPRDGWYWAAAMILLFVPATMLAPVAATGLAALTPQCYMTFRPVRATALMVVLCTGPAFAFLTDSGLPAVVTLLILTVMVACSLLLGVFIDRLGAQNRERARLIVELDQTRAELAEVSKEAGIIAERERLARDIHDTLAQGFASITMLLQAAEAETGPNHHLERATRIARENMAETRVLVAALAPPALADTSLGDVLDRLAKNFDLPVQLIVSGTARPLSSAIEAVLLRVTQEGLTNVRKHAGSTSVLVALSYGDRRVRLSIGDNGRGLRPGGRAGYGLSGMRSRVAEVDGTMHIDSTPGQGTTIAVEIPCSG